jgi:hypothetical protein
MNGQLPMTVANESATRWPFVKFSTTARLTLITGGCLWL